MTQDEIIEMARQAGLPEAIIEMTPIAFERFAKLVAEKEREACAKICDSFQERDVGMQPAECAGAIRARNKHEN
jgi:hypothetical protein